MKKTLFISLIFILASLFSYGQKFNYNIKLSYNLPYIAEIKETPNLYPPISTTTGFSSYTTNYTLNESYSSKSGGRISGNIVYQINSRLIIEGGIQLNLLRFQQKTEVTGLDDIFSGRIIEIDTSLIIGEPFWEIYPETRLPVENKDDLGKSSVLYTEIPINIGYTFFNNKLKCKLGIISSFLAYAEVYDYRGQGPHLSQPQPGYH